VNQFIEPNPEARERELQRPVLEDVVSYVRCLIQALASTRHPEKGIKAAVIKEGVGSPLRRT
jgi:hypothetical protein